MGARIKSAVGIGLHGALSATGNRTDDASILDLWTDKNREICASLTCTLDWSIGGGRRPDKLALSLDDIASLSYSELGRWSDGIAERSACR
jgi:hypothetical protein